MGNNAHNDEMEIDLREIFFLLLGKLWIIILSAIVGGICFLAYTYAFINPIYQSESMIYILTKTTSLTSLADLQVGTQLTNDYVVFIKSRPVLDKVIDNLDLELSYQQLESKIQINNPNNTRILELIVSDEDPAMAQKIVNELTDVACERVAAVMNTEAPSIVDYGHIAQRPSSPSKAKNAIMGAMLAAFIAIAIIVILYLMNDSINTSEDVEKYLGLNTLGTIPLEEGTSKKATHGHDKDADKLKKRKGKGTK